MLRLRLAVLFAGSTVPLLSSACGPHTVMPGSGGSTTSSSSGAAPSGGSGGCGADCSPDPDGGVDAGCNLTSLPLIVSTDTDDVRLDLHTPVGYQTTPAVLIVDTGSQVTFLQEPLGSPDPVVDAATFQLGCESLHVVGRPTLTLDPVNGVPTVGFLGIDFLTRGPTEFDFDVAQILLHDPGNPFPAAAGWPAAPFELINGSVVVSVTLDGNPVRIIVDTGSQDTLWIGQQGQPGDVPQETSDAYGNDFTVYRGTVDLEVGGVHRTVRVLRAPTFPNYDPPAPDVVGLLGLTSLGNAFVFDTDASLVRIDAM